MSNGFISDKGTVIGNNGGSGGGGGHTILNRIATALSQRTKLWFADAEVSDDSTNDRTKVEIIKDGLTETQFDALSLDGSADGEYLVEGESEVPLSANDVDGLTNLITGTIQSGSTSITLNDNRIKTTSIIDIYFENKVLAPTDVTVTNGSITIEISAQDSDTNVGVRCL